MCFRILHYEETGIVGVGTLKLKRDRGPCIAGHPRISPGSTFLMVAGDGGVLMSCNAVALQGKTP